MTLPWRFPDGTARLFFTMPGHANGDALSDALRWPRKENRGATVESVLLAEGESPKAVARSDGPPPRLTACRRPKRSISGGRDHLT
ncbi:hypothetical protein [Nonomuraea sp. NPDC049784]|uniref:hypothetical protein n=1 Tax=Nonomuraea sp. NPDC049784 TaxID=3154361 RepID=UPI00340B8101